MDEVKTFLESIGLNSYVQTFEEKGWDDLDTVLEMSDDDIRTCITKPGHVKKLSLKIKKVRNEGREIYEETTEDTQDIKKNSSLMAGFEGSSVDELEISATLQRNITETSDRNKGENEHDTTPPQTETCMLKQETTDMTEAGGFDVKEETLTGDSMIDKFTEPADLRNTDKDSMLIKKSGTSITKDIIQHGHLATSVCLNTITSQNTITVSGVENTSYHGDMPLITNVRDSENVTIARDVHVQHVTNQYESCYSNFKGQIRSVLKSDGEKDKRLFEETRAYREAKDIIEDLCWAVITGNAGEGKTTMGKHLLRQYMQQGYEPLIITSVEDWKHLVKGNGKEQAKQIVLIDDIFGTISVDERKVNDWASLFEMIGKLLDERNGDLKVVCTVRTLIYSEVKTKLSRFECFKKIRIVNLSEERFALQENEKINMLKKYFCFYNIEIDVSEIQEISTIIFSHGFPHCVEMYCTNLSLRQKGLDFFHEPIKLLENEFVNLYECDKKSFVALTMLVVAVDRHIRITMYSDEDQLASVYGVAAELLNVSNTTVPDIRPAFERMKNVYVNIGDYDEISFSHPSYYELVYIVVTKMNPLAAVKFFDINFLVNNTKSHCDMKANEDIIILPKSCYKHLVERFTEALIDPVYPDLSVLQHDVWDDVCFIKLWINHASQEKRFCENYDSVLLKLLFWEGCDFMPLAEQKLLGLFALNKHEEIIIEMLKHPTLQGYWTTTHGKSHLSYAVLSASRGDCSANLLKQLIKNGADVNYNNDFTMGFPIKTYALSYAVENNNIENANVLLENGASIFSDDGDTAFKIAVDKENLDMINLILNHMKRCTAGKQSCLYGEDYSATLTGDDFDCLSELLIKTSKNMSVLKELLCNLRTAGIILSKESLIHVLKNTEQVEQVMEILTSCGYILFDEWELFDYSALLTSRKDPIQSIEALRKFGFDINAKDVDGLSILETTFLENMQENRHTLFLYLISQGINVNNQNEYGTSPIQTILRFVKLSTECIGDVLKLIDLSDVKEIEDFDGQNCFHFLALNCHPVHKDILGRLVNHLLQKECDINKKNKYGLIPLHFCCKLDMIEMFIGCGANTRITDKKKRNFPMVKIIDKYQDILGVLSIFSQIRLDLTSTDVNGRNLLHYVGASRYNTTLKKQLFDFLINKGLNVNQKDKRNKTPLIVLAQHPKCKSTLIQFMIQNGASVSEKDNTGFTVLHHCIRSVTSEKEKLAIVESLSKYFSDDVIGHFTLSLQYAGCSVISYFLNNLKSKAECVFKMSKILIHFNCKADVIHVVLLLIEKLGSHMMSLFEADEDFKKALLVRKNMGNPLFCRLKEIYKNGINVSWFSTVNRNTEPGYLSSIENVGDIIFTNDDDSPEFSLAKTGHFKLLLFFLQHRTKEWIVNKKELSKFLNVLTSCLDYSTVEKIIRILFTAEYNCACYKTIAYSTLKYWCKQRNLCPRCIKVLLEHGDIKSADKGNESLVFCVMETYIQNQQIISMENLNEIVTLLAEFNFKCDLPNEFGVTPLMYLLKHGETQSEHEIIDFLISKSANLSQLDHEGNNIIHYLILSNIEDEKCINVIEESKLSAISKDITGSSFLAKSAGRLSSELVTYFIQQGIDTNGSDNLGITPIHRIIVSDILIKCSFDKNGVEFQKRKLPWYAYSHNQQEKNAFEPVTHTDILSTVNAALDCLHKLLEHGADPNLMDVIGKTPLHYCAESPIFDAFICPAMSLLISYGADVDLEDYEGRTPLMLCLQFEKSKYRRLNILIQAGAKLFSEDYNGSNVLHYAQVGIRKRLSGEDLKP